MEDFRKGQDILLDAMASCVSNGLDVRLSVVGSGRIQGSLEARARDLGLKLLVNFTGQLSPERVVAELDRSDLFCFGLARGRVAAGVVGGNGTWFTGDRFPCRWLSRGVARI